MIDKFWTRVYMFLLVHELEPKKMGIWLERVDKTINIFGTLRVSLSRKVWWAIQIINFRPRIEVFYTPDWSKGMTTWKWILSIRKLKIWCYKHLERIKDMEKWGHLSSSHVSFLSYDL